MDKFRIFVYILMRDASLKQRIPCIMRISLFGAFSAGKKCALYTDKYGNASRNTPYAWLHTEFSLSADSKLKNWVLWVLSCLLFWEIAARWERQSIAKLPSTLTSQPSTSKLNENPDTRLSYFITKLCFQGSVLCRIAKAVQIKTIPTWDRIMWKFLHVGK